MNWAVLRFMSGFDNGRNVGAHLTRQGFTWYCPLTTEIWHKQGQKVRRKVALFPGYMFVAIETAWSAILGTPGAIGLIMGGDHPQYIDSEIIDQLKSDEQDGVFEQADTPRFRADDPVRLANDAGAYADRIVIYQGMTGEGRCAVLLKLLTKQVRLVVPESALIEVI